MGTMMHTYQYPDDKTMTKVIGIAPHSDVPRCQHWERKHAHELDFAALDRGVGLEYCYNDGLFQIWKREETYLGIVSQWGRITVLVETEDREKLTDWFYWKGKVVA